MTAVVGFVVAGAVVAGIYFLVVLPGERHYHETKLRLMRERIERFERAREQRGSAAEDD